MKRTAVYLALEDGHSRLKSRLKKMLAGEVAPKNLMLFNRRQHADKGGLADLEALLSENPDIRIIVIDVWHKIRTLKKTKGVYAHEIDYSEAAKIEHLADKSGTAIILITHLLEPGWHEWWGDIFDKVSGSTGITGAADVNLVVTNTETWHMPSCISQVGT